MLRLLERYLADVCFLISSLCPGYSKTASLLVERDQDGEAVSRQNMEGKTALHLAAARGESWEDREGTRWGGGQQAEHGGKDSTSLCCRKR
jgi:hypothetical protein